MYRHLDFAKIFMYLENYLRQRLTNISDRGCGHRILKRYLDFQRKERIIPSGGGVHKYGLHCSYTHSTHFCTPLRCTADAPKMHLDAHKRHLRRT